MEYLQFSVPALVSTTATLQCFQKVHLKFEICCKFAHFSVVNTRHQIAFIRRLLLNLVNKTKRNPCASAAKKCLLIQPHSVYVKVNFFSFPHILIKGISSWACVINVRLKPSQLQQRIHKKPNLSETKKKNQKEWFFYSLPIRKIKIISILLRTVFKKKHPKNIIYNQAIPHDTAHLLGRYSKWFTIQEKGLLVGGQTQKIRQSNYKPTGMDNKKKPWR